MVALFNRCGGICSFVFVISGRQHGSMEMAAALFFSGFFIEGCAIDFFRGVSFVGHRDGVYNFV